jgi:hypothetical protein
MSVSIADECVITEVPSFRAGMDPVEEAYGLDVGSCSREVLGAPCRRRHRGVSSRDGYVLYSTMLESGSTFEAPYFTYAQHRHRERALPS